jgi:hypothetical protein
MSSERKILSLVTAAVRDILTIHREETTFLRAKIDYLQQQIDELKGGIHGQEG